MMHIKSLSHAHQAATAMSNCGIVIVDTQPKTISANNTNNVVATHTIHVAAVAHEEQHHQQQQQQQQHNLQQQLPTPTEIALPFNMHLNGISAEAHSAAQAAAMAAAQAAAAQAAAADQNQPTASPTQTTENTMAHLVATSPHSPMLIESQYISNGHAKNNELLGEGYGKVSIGSGGREPEKSFHCNVCDRRFRQLSTLTNHVKIHTGEKPYKCNVCDKTFRQSSTLTNHFKIHTGEKPYNCNYCPKHFRQLSTLANHVKIHTGEKPFECDICQKQFRQSSTLNNHIKIHVMDKVYVPVKIKTEEDEG